MLENRFTISHSIHGPGFKYDVLKCELSKGSHISKTTHPVAEVELLKQRLLQRKVLKDMGTYWELKKSLRTGILMAFNLHTGQLVKESLYHQNVVVTESEAEKLKGKFPEKQVCTTDSEIVMKSIRDTQRFSSVNIVEVDKEVLNHHGSDSFGKEEAFVLKILQEQGVVSASARHGEAGKNEADIVDETTGDQFEITYEFKISLLSKKKMQPSWLFDPATLLLQLVDNPFIHTTKSLMKKFEREYTDRYRTNLVILTLGTKQAIVSMLEALSKELKKSKRTEISFSSVYIIALDFIGEKVIFCRISPGDQFFVEQFPYKNDDLGFIKMTPVAFSAMENGKKYLMVCRDIFEDLFRCRYDEATELRKWAKGIRIWGIPKDNMEDTDEDDLS